MAGVIARQRGSSQVAENPRENHPLLSRAPFSHHAVATFSARLCVSWACPRAALLYQKKVSGSEPLTGRIADMSAL